MVQSGEGQAYESPAIVTPAGSVYLLVLLWEPHHVGGVNVVVKALATQIGRDTDLTPRIAVSDWEARRPVEEGTSMRLRFALIGRKSPWGLLKALLGMPHRLIVLQRFLRRHDVAVVNFHYFSIEALGVALLKLAGVYRGKLVMSIHGTDVRVPDGSIERWCRRLIVASADALIAVSRSLAARASALMDVPPGRIEVVYNGVDMVTFHPQARAPLAVGAEAGRYVVSIGRYVEAKGQACLVDAFARLADRYADLNLVLIGDDGPELERLETRVRAHCLQHRVQLLGFLEPGQIAELLARCDVCVQPSLSEGLGMVLLEAGAVGAPLVVSDIAGHDELVDHGVTGLRFCAGDPASCAEAVAALLDDPYRARLMAARHRQRVATSFSWGQCVRGYIRAIGLSERLCPQGHDQQPHS